MKKSQRQVIKEILMREGRITNFSAIEKKMTLRLGARIQELREEGMPIEGGFIEGTKNFEYRLLSHPSNEAKLEVVGLWYEKDPWTSEVLVDREHEIYGPA